MVERLGVYNLFEMNVDSNLDDLSYPSMIDMYTQNKSVQKFPNFDLLVCCLIASESVVCGGNIKIKVKIIQKKMMYNIFAKIYEQYSKIWDARGTLLQFKIWFE